MSTPADQLKPAQPVEWKGRKTKRAATFPSPQPKRALGSQEAAQVLAHLANQGSLRSAAKLINWDDMTLWERLASDHSQAYALAREVRAIHSADRLYEITEALLKGEYEPDTVRVAGNFLQWLAERQDGRRWGNRPADAPEGPQAVAPDALLAQILAMDNGTGLLAKLGLKIERTTTTVTAAAQVETKPAPEGDKPK